ncbi:MAG: cupin domain-containing protein [bacterium]|nr:cupin domain-containing protein [bacterium]
MIVKNIKNIEKQSIGSVHRGEGVINLCRPFIAEDFESDWNFVDFAIIPPGSSIGIHKHGEDEEMYFILEGRGIITVNGEEREVCSGDLILNKPGWSHGIRNESKEEIKILVVEVKLKRPL